MSKYVITKYHEQYSTHLVHTSGIYKNSYTKRGSAIYTLHYPGKKYYLSLYREEYMIVLLDIKYLVSIQFGIMTHINKTISSQAKKRLTKRFNELSHC